jgi:hypothetical protein
MLYRATVTDTAATVTTTTGVITVEVEEVVVVVDTMADTTKWALSAVASEPSIGRHRSSPHSRKTFTKKINESQKEVTVKSKTLGGKKR